MATTESHVIEQWVHQLQQASELDRLAATNEVMMRTRGAVRTRGIRAAAAAQAPGQALQQAVEVLQREQSPDVQRGIVLALGRIGGVREVTALSQIARGNVDPSVRAIALESLGQIGGEEALKALRESALRDGHEVVRARAVAALGELAVAAQRSGEDPEPVVQVLAEVRDTDRSSYVRDLTLETLETL